MSKAVLAIVFSLCVVWIFRSNRSDDRMISPLRPKAVVRDELGVTDCPERVLRKNRIKLRIPVIVVRGYTALKLITI